MDRVNRWMYKGRRPNAIARTLNRLWAKLFQLGMAGDTMASIEVAGRTTGEPVIFPVVVVEHDGERYLVSMLGQRGNWIRNVRAAAGRATLLKGGRTPVHLVEIDAAERAPIIKRFCELAPGGRSHIPVDKDAPLADFERIAADYPVFRIDLRDNVE